jgi:hypothetical protein
VRPGDFIAVTQAEAELLTSDRFKEVAPNELVRKVILTPRRTGATTYYDLALPKVGARVVEALERLASRDDVRPREAIIAQGLAEAIQQRTSVT